MKRFAFNFYPFEKDKILNYLNHKLNQGYLLNSVDFRSQTATFIENEYSFTHYDLTIHNIFQPIVEENEYVDSCLLCGWERICSDQGVYIFVNHDLVKPFPLSDDFTDRYSEESKLKEYIETIGWLPSKQSMPLLLAFFVFIIWDILINKDLSFWAYINLPIIFLSLYLKFSKSKKFRQNCFPLTGIVLVLINVVFYIFGLHWISLLFFFISIVLIISLFWNEHPILLENLDYPFYLGILFAIYFLLAYYIVYL